jgi:ketosteroid isomerase-like protein
MHRFYEEWVHPGNLDVVDEIIALDCPLYFGGMFMGTGPEAFKEVRARLYSGFPDFRWTVDEVIAEGETVAERLTGRGTHQGEFMGVPATGTQVEIPAVAMMHIREGKIAEMRSMPDTLGPDAKDRSGPCAWRVGASPSSWPTGINTTRAATSLFTRVPSTTSLDRCSAADGRQIGRK